MNKFLLMMFFGSLFGHISYAQTYALVDLKAKLPILYSDSVTSEHYAHGYIPIEKARIGDLYKQLSDCSKLLGKLSRSKIDISTFSMGNSLVQVTRVEMANADRYVISVITAIPNAQLVRSFGDEDQYNKRTKKKIDRFLEYMKKNLTDIKLLN